MKSKYIFFFLASYMKIEKQIFILSWSNFTIHLFKIYTVKYLLKIFRKETEQFFFIGGGEIGSKIMQRRLVHSYIHVYKDRVSYFSSIPKKGLPKK